MTDLLAQASQPAPSPDARRAVTHHEYLLAELRCASLRARLIQADIDAVGIALKDGRITPEQALELLHDCNVLWIVGAEPSPDAEALAAA
jgi:hypothetical protein